MNARDKVSSLVMRPHIIVAFTGIHPDEIKIDNA
jgi:hypothetical protein